MTRKLDNDGPSGWYSLLVIALLMSGCCGVFAGLIDGAKTSFEKWPAATIVGLILIVIGGTIWGHKWLMKRYDRLPHP